MDRNAIRPIDIPQGKELHVRRGALACCCTYSTGLLYSRSTLVLLPTPARFHWFQHRNLAGASLSDKGKSFAPRRGMHPRPVISPSAQTRFPLPQVHPHCFHSTMEAGGSGSFHRSFRYVQRGPTRRQWQQNAVATAVGRFPLTRLRLSTVAPPQSFAPHRRGELGATPPSLLPVDGVTVQRRGATYNLPLAAIRRQWRTSGAGL
jgi:hypothetical protein